MVSRICAETGVGPPSVPDSTKCTPWMWIGWLSMLRLARRTRTRCPFFTINGDVPGKTRALKLKRLNSSIVAGFGVALPKGKSHSCRKMAKSRSMRCRSFFGWMMKKPSMPSAICSVSSAWGWYICVPL